jgi:hypothetical protein
MVQRRFGGNDVSLLAVFGAFEVLHNFGDFCMFVNGKDESKDYVKRWYKGTIEGLYKGDLQVYPNIYHYVFSRPFMTKKKKAEIEKRACKECLSILSDFGILSYIEEKLKNCGIEIRQEQT